MTKIREKLLHRAGVVALLAALQGTASCQPSPHLPGRLVYEGEFLRYSTTLDEPICRGSFILQEAYIRGMAALIGADIRMPINYAKISSLEAERYCQDSRYKGCYTAGIAYSNSSVSFHELAHAVADAGDVRGPRPFREGFAEVFGNGINGDQTRTDLRATLKHFPDDLSGYYTVALFVRFLLEEYGIDPLLEFMRQTDLEDSYETWAPRFAEVLGVELEAAVEAFAQYPACSRWQNRDALVECSSAPTPWKGDVWSAQVELDCARDDVLGPIASGARNVIWTERAVDIAQDGEYLIIPTGNADVWGKISMTRCGSCWDAVELALTPSSEPQWVQLPAGRYHLLFARDLATPDAAGIAVKKSL